MRWLGGCLMAVLCVACEREPAIVVRFDSVDQGVVQARRDLASPPVIADAAVSRDASIPPDLAASGKSKANGCANTSDCVLVEDGCCSCANGGRLKAVLKRDEPRLAAARKKACAETVCTMMVSTDPSCGQRVDCVAGECVMRPARADELRKLVPLKNDAQ